MSEDIIDLYLVEKSIGDNAKSWELVDAEYKKLIDKLSSLRIDEVFRDRLEAIDTASRCVISEEDAACMDSEFETVEDMRKYLAATFDLTWQEKREKEIIDLTNEIIDLDLELTPVEVSEELVECLAI